MNQLSETSVVTNISDYSRMRLRDGRYASFDYCFNYFRQFEANDSIRVCDHSNLEVSCLQLGFYLASWGMYRNSELLNKSAIGLAPALEVIAGAPPELWNVDLDSYSESNIERILNMRNDLRRVLPHKKNFPTDTLITKVMLGVFGCVPAFDRFFVLGSGLQSPNERALLHLRDFYDSRKVLIDNGRQPTLNFSDGTPTENRYTRAKVVDMIYFVDGFNQSRR